MNLKLNLPTSNGPDACLFISGELDQMTLKYDYWPRMASKERDAVSQSGKLIVDLSDVDRSDTAGLAWLINLVKHAKVDKVKVSFQSVPDKLLNLADLSGAKSLLIAE